MPALLVAAAFALRFARSTAFGRRRTDRSRSSARWPWSRCRSWSTVPAFTVREEVPQLAPGRRDLRRGRTRRAPSLELDHSTQYSYRADVPVVLQRALARVCPGRDAGRTGRIRARAVSAAAAPCSCSCRRPKGIDFDRWRTRRSRSRRVRTTRWPSTLHTAPTRPADRDGDRLSRPGRRGRCRCTELAKAPTRDLFLLDPARSRWPGQDPRSPPAPPSRRPPAGRAGRRSSRQARPRRLRRAPGARARSRARPPASLAAAMTSARVSRRAGRGRPRRPRTARRPRSRVADGPRRRSRAGAGTAAAPKPRVIDARLMANTSGARRRRGQRRRADEGDLRVVVAGASVTREPGAPAAEQDRDRDPVGRQRDQGRITHPEAELVQQQEVRLGHPVGQRLGRQLDALTGRVVVEGDQRTARLPAARTAANSAPRPRSPWSAPRTLSRCSRAGSSRPGRRCRSARSTPASSPRRRTGGRACAAEPVHLQAVGAELQGDAGDLDDSTTVAPGIWADSVLAWLAIPLGYSIVVVGIEPELFVPTTALKPAALSCVGVRGRDTVGVRGVEHGDRERSGSNGRGRRRRLNRRLPIRSGPARTPAPCVGVISTTLPASLWPLMLSSGIVWKVMLPSAISEKVSASPSRLTPSVSSDELTALSRLCTVNGLSSVPEDGQLVEGRLHEVLLALDPVEVAERQAVALADEGQRLRALDDRQPGREVDAGVGFLLGGAQHDRHAADRVADAVEAEQVDLDVVVDGQAGEVAAGSGRAG